MKLNKNFKSFKFIMQFLIISEDLIDFIKIKFSSLCLIYEKKNLHNTRVINNTEYFHTIKKINSKQEFNYSHT